MRAKRRTGWLTIAACSLALAGCGEQGYPRVSLREGAETSVQRSPRVSGKIPLRVAIAAVVSPGANLDAYERLLAYLSDKVDRPVQLAQRGTYAEINRLIRSRAADIGFVCTGAYIEGQREFGMELLVAPEVRGQTTYFSYIVVRRDSTAQSLADLRGHRFAFTDPLSNTGHLAVQWALHLDGQTPETFFSSTIFTYSHDNSIRAVSAGLVDGAAIDSLVYDFVMAQTPGDRFQLKIVGKLGPFGIPPVVVHPALDSALKEQLRGALLDMTADERGRAALAPLMVDRFVRLEDSAYDSTRTMATVIRGWPKTR